MNKFRVLPGLIMSVLVAVGCSSTRTVQVPVPPRVSLAPYQTIGLISFASNDRGELQQLGTQRFMAQVQAAQPGTRIVELGSESQVLASVNKASFDAATFKAIKQTHGVDAILTGRIDVEKAKPSVQLSTVWNTVGVRADVNASLSARLIETASGATVWTNGSKMTENVAKARVSDRGGSFAATDSNSAYANMVDYMTYTVTDDFRTHFVLKRVPKDQVASAD